MLDDITQAVLAREEVARYLRGGPGQTELEARERIHAYLDELRTTQRYPIYRALKHPLYPILRKIERIDEHVEIAQQATKRRAGHLHFESQEPPGLPRRAAGPRRQRRPTAGHRRRHQPVRRPARPDPSTRDRSDSDPAQHEGSGVPRHAQGVRRRAAPAARSAVLLRGRTQLLGRAEDAEDRTAACRRMQADARRGRSCRWRWPTTWCSRTTSSRTRPASGGSVRSRARWPRWSATRSAISRGRSSRSASRSA